MKNGSSFGPEATPTGPCLGLRYGGNSRSKVAEAGCDFDTC